MGTKVGFEVSDWQPKPMDEYTNEELLEYWYKLRLTCRVKEVDGNSSSTDLVLVTLQQEIVSRMSRQGEGKDLQPSISNELNENYVFLPKYNENDSLDGYIVLRSKDYTYKQAFELYDGWKAGKQYFDSFTDYLDFRNIVYSELD